MDHVFLDHCAKSQLHYVYATDQSSYAMAEQEISIPITTPNTITDTYS